MPANIVVGLQWGDEGKGKIIDYLAKDADLVARYNGGDNAGHTVYVGDQKFALHLLPSGVVRGKKVAIGNGVAINPDTLKKEIDEVNSKGVYFDLTVDERAHVITPEHLERDLANKGTIGSTGKGIGPCYTDRASRKGTRMRDYAKTHPEFKRFLGDVSTLVNDYIDDDKNVLIEGAQGTLLSVNWGTYPFVTSSEPTAGGACVGLGISPKKIDRIIGVAKACQTRVGRGPFPTELGTEEKTTSENKDEPLKLEDIEKANEGDPYYIGKVLRKKGKEYGTTTGRARRTGWFDAVSVKYAARINGLDEMVITKLDVLGGTEEVQNKKKIFCPGLKKLKVCHHYNIGDKQTDEFPLELEEVKPIYADFDGWEGNVISKAGNFDGLPKNARRYVEMLEWFVGVPVKIIGVGPEREQIILR